MGKQSGGSVIATLGAAVLTVAVLQTGFVPIVAAISTQLHVSVGSANWGTTANLLISAAATPLIGRLADVFSRKSVLMATLGVVLAGSLLGALTSSLPLLILARALQGTSFALYPVAVSIVRDELPAQRLIRAIAALSTTLGLGGAIGLLFTGVLMPEGASYHRVFWLVTVMTAAVTILAAVTVPSRPHRAAERVDWVGGVALATGLTILMLAITQASSWGIARTAVTAVAGVAVLAAWRSWTRNTAHPLVSTEMLKSRPIVLANWAGFLVGMGSYFSLLGLSNFAGYGFGASARGVSLQFMLPGALAATGIAVVAGRLIERFGARAVVATGGVAGVIGFALLALWHTERWQLVLAGLITNAYISLAYGALPALIVDDVDPGDTAVANSLNGIFRKVGGSTAAAVVGALLTPAGGGAPTESSFVVVFVAGAVTAAGAVLLVWLARVRISRRAGAVRLFPVPPRPERGALQAA